MELKDYCEGDELKIIDLFQLVFKQKMSLEQWNWRFRDNPAGKHFVKLMWDNEVLVGHYAVSPIYVQVHGIRYLTAHSLTTMTHPEYGGKGIFKTLANALYEDLEKKHGFFSVWGFPNNNSHYGFINSLGWKDIGVVHTLSRPNTNSEPHCSMNFQEVKSLSPDICQLIADEAQKFSVSVSKTSDYLQWRYESKPSITYRFFVAQNNEKTNVLVTKLFRLSDDTFKVNICESAIQDYSILPQMLSEISKEYSENIIEFTLWQNIHTSTHRQYEKIGFKPVQPITYLGALSMNNIPEPFLDFRNWSISMGDSDVF